MTEGSSSPTRWNPCSPAFRNLCCPTSDSGTDRTFEKPGREGQRVLLHFGAVDYQCQVWINGKAIGSHTGGYLPFTFDITDALKDEENELTVSVWDPTDTGLQQRGKQVLNPRGIWYTPISGIWQTVWLEMVPEIEHRVVETDTRPG